MKYRSGVYAILGPTGGIYIGASKNIDNRWEAHKTSLNTRKKHYSKSFLDDWDMYGWDKFTLVLIEPCDTNMLDERENFHLDRFKPSYNLDHSVSGRSGCVRSEESRNRMSAAANKRWSCKGEREAQALRATGKVQSPETIAKRVPKLTGQKRTAEQRKKMSEAPRKPRKLGVRPSPETLAKIKAFWSSEKGKALTQKALAARWAKKHPETPRDG